MPFELHTLISALLCNKFSETHNKIINSDHLEKKPKVKVVMGFLEPAKCRFFKLKKLTFCVSHVF